MNYWLHRIAHCAPLSYPLLDKGYLTIGFSDFAEKALIDKVLEGDRNHFDNQFKARWSRIPRSRHQLWRFLHFQKGDVVIVPCWGTLFVCEITGDRPLPISEVNTDHLRTWGNKQVHSDGGLLLSENGKAYDLGFARKVKLLHREVPRAKYANAKLSSRLKIRCTNASLNDLKKSVDSCIADFVEKRPIHLHSILLERSTGPLLDAIKSSLNPDKFEKLIKSYFQTIGATQVRIPAKNARTKVGDADIVAVFDHIKVIIYVQAKFHQGKTSAWGARQILDYRIQQQSNGNGYTKIAWLLSTADAFTDGAIRTAAEHGIQLINGREFTEMIANAGLGMLSRVK